MSQVKLKPTFDGKGDIVRVSRNRASANLCRRYGLPIGVLRMGG